MTSTTVHMKRSFTHNIQRSTRTNIFTMNAARDENVVTIADDDATTSDGGEGELTWLNSAVFKYTHDCSRFYPLPPPFSS